jgi:acetyltransferase-like isoleucine patch superfamily enzyme
MSLVSPGLVRRLATSDRMLPGVLRRFRRAVITFSVPAPRAVTVPLLWAVVSIRSVYAFLLRVFICEPLFKARCTRYGKRLRTDRHLHWVSGFGDIIVGDDVWLDGRSTITFAARFADRPLLEIGDRTRIGHECVFTVGSRISIGRNCLLSGGIQIMDSNGHPVDPRERWNDQPPGEEDVRPVTIGDGVWIGKQCIIFPGVRIGEGSVVSAGSIVRGHVPPYGVVAGNPAKMMFRLKRPAETGHAT